jgi:hypothetical protein
MTTPPSHVVAMEESEINAVVVDVNEPNAGAPSLKLTREERTRFMKAFPKDAEVQIEEYLAWRKQYCPIDDDGTQDVDLPDDDDDAAWRWAVVQSSERRRNTGLCTASTGGSNDAAISSTKSFSLLEKPKYNSRTHSCETQSTVESSASDVLRSDDSSLSSHPNKPKLPQIVFNHRQPNNVADAAANTATDNDDSGDKNNKVTFLRDKEGHRILHILAARLDPSLADASFYATSLALYLDRCIDLDRTSLERVTLLLDVRPGKGWRNLPALELVSFTRQLVGRLQTLFPDRLHRCILFPVPRPAIVLWKVFSVFLHENTRSSVCLVAGGATLNSPVPRTALGRYIDETYIGYCEDVRLSYFDA